jgi:hypothetical protein
MVVWGWESRLCVEMKRGRFAKEGLIQYRIVCQQVNVASLEEVRRVLPLTAASPVCRLSVACQHSLRRRTSHDMWAGSRPALRVCR